MTITDEKLTEIEQRAAKATPGPWTTAKPPADIDGWPTGSTIACVARGQCVYAYPPGGIFPENDRRFIAAAREDVPALCRQLREMREKLRELRETIADGSAEVTGDLKNASAWFCSELDALIGDR
jgi:hypothetical protein